MSDNKDEERRKIMEDILNDHYCRSEKVNDEVIKHSIPDDEKKIKTETENHFCFENFNGVPCEMRSYIRSGSEHSITYCRIEVTHSIKTSCFSLFCFIPQSDLDAQLPLKNMTNIIVPYKIISENVYNASLPN